MKGADVASDNPLLLAKLKPKLKNNWTGEQTERHKFNVSVLKDPKTKEEFNLSLIHKFQVLQELWEEEKFHVEMS